MNTRSKKRAAHQPERRLIFEKSVAGKARRSNCRRSMCPRPIRAKALGASIAREGVEGFPEVSEIEVIRHFTRLSTWNYAIDLGMYPLGSCTMKYNPRVNEFVARLDGIATRASLPAAGTFARLPEDSATAGKMPAGNHRAWTPSRCSRRRARRAN